MNRKQRRAERTLSHQNAAQYPERLTELSSDKWASIAVSGLARVWISRKYLVQLFNEPDIVRLSICRTTRNTQQQWDDKLTWDELQAIKRDVGFGDWYAVEVYPRDCDMVNVANMRHLWVCEFPLRIGWTNGIVSTTPCLKAEVSCEGF